MAGGTGVVVVPARLAGFCAAVLEKLEVPEPDARLVADTLIQADLRGIETHGVTRLRSYVDRLKAGGMVAKTDTSLVSDSGSIVVVDGGGGLGQVIAARAMTIAIERGKVHGIACTAVRRSSHIGAVSYYSRMALTEEMIGFAVSGSPRLMAPWGGLTRLLSSGPWSIAIPAGRELPIVVDFANNAMNGGKIARMGEMGQRLPPGTALNERGEPTEDPAEALRGLILPMGGHKGYGLIVALEVLSSVLTGAAFSTDIALIAEVSRPLNLGHLMVVLRIDRFMPIDEFRARVDDLVGRLHGARLAPGVDRIFVPGERSELLAMQRLVEGIPLRAPIAESLSALAAEMSVPPPF